MNMQTDEEVLKEKIRREERLAARDFYGDIVRNLFVSADIIILLTLPFFSPRLQLPFLVAIFGVVILALAAALTSWNAKWSLIADAVIAGFSLIFIEYNAIVEYRAPTTSWIFVFFCQVLALLFFIALYYSAQTLRRWER